MKKLTTRIALVAITVFMLIQNVSAAQFLIPVGQIIGLQINQNQVTIDGKAYTPQEISAMILQKLKADAERR